MRMGEGCGKQYFISIIKNPFGVVTGLKNTDMIYNEYRVFH